jgi:hypothetical protein
MQVAEAGGPSPGHTRQHMNAGTVVSQARIGGVISLPRQRGWRIKRMGGGEFEMDGMEKRERMSVVPPWPWGTKRSKGS